MAALTLCEGIVTDANGVCFCSSNVHLVKTVKSMQVWLLSSGTVVFACFAVVTSQTS